MLGSTVILCLLILLAAIYFLGPVSIYLIGLITLLCILCCSSLSSMPMYPANPAMTNTFPSAQCGGYGTNGFDMTPDQVYAAFRAHPYNGENLGYGYYDGYDYVL